MEVKYGNPSIESIHACITEVAGKNPDSFFEKLEEKEGLSPFVKNYLLGSFFPRMLTFSAHAPESKDGIPFIPESPTKDLVLYNAASSVLLDILPHLYSLYHEEELKEKVPVFLDGKSKSKSAKAAFKILEGIKKSLAAHFGFTDSDFARLKISIETALKAKKNDFEAYLKILDTFEYRNVKAQTADFILDSFTKKFVYKEEPSEKYLAQIAEIIPHCSAFFIPYLRGFEAVASLDFAAALKFYLEAFENLSFAGDWTSDFLRQAVALFLYNKKEKEAQKFIEAGEEVGVFVQNSKVFAAETARRDFYIQFNLKMFKDFEKVRAKALKDVKIPYTDKIREAIDFGDLKKFKALCPVGDAGNEIDSMRIEGASLLYYAIQRKGVVRQGAEVFTQNLVAAETDRSFRAIDLSKLSPEERRTAALKIQHSMRDTYEKSGLGNLLFEASCGSEKEIPPLLKKLDILIAFIAENTSDVDSFTRQIEGSFGTNALGLAAELDDAQSARILLERGASPSKQNGSAPFGMNYSDGSKVSVELPNNFLYRMISFKSFETLKLFLTEFTDLARPMMTATSKKSNITPLVYLILTQIYAASTKEEYNANSKIVNELIPLFEEAGAKIRQQTAFGTAEELLGMKR